METTLCLECEDEKDVNDFNFRNRQKGTRANRCRECARKLSKERYRKSPEKWIEKAKRRNVRVRRENRIKLIRYLQQHPCIDCGESDVVVLDFDHVRGKKRHDVTRMAALCYSWEVILKEITKCEIRCANCHRRRTAKAHKFLKYTVSEPKWCGD